MPFHLVKRLKADGGGILYIPHRLDEIHQIIEALAARPLERMFPGMPEPGEDVVPATPSAT
ncbi:hypothetical protein [Pseudogemmobacter bohemicus]|uniref:hypothetical protein n=1 Tax=Pseudogemmobacter bohemicus TaxID=2250708 RepID=UPI0013001883|nr:hypothetical protein [Pseudogemmobacter bohemicus]